MNMYKCSFCQTEVAFLRHMVSATVSANLGKVMAITQLDLPLDVPAVKFLLGFLNHLAKFLPGLTDLTKPLETCYTKMLNGTRAQLNSKALKNIKKFLYDRLLHTVSVDTFSYGLGAEAATAVA